MLLHGIQWTTSYMHVSILKSSTFTITITFTVLTITGHSNIEDYITLLNQISNAVEQKAGI